MPFKRKCTHQLTDSAHAETQLAFDTSCVVALPEHWCEADWSNLEAYATQLGWYQLWQSKNKAKGKDGKPMNLGCICCKLQEVTSMLAYVFASGDLVG